MTATEKHFPDDSDSEQTLISPSRYQPPNQDASSVPASMAPNPAIALIEGSGPELSRETQQLLRNRLQLAAVVILTGFTVFLTRHLIVGDYRALADVLFVMLLSITTLILGFFVVAIYFRKEVELWKLRVAEAMIFGLPTMFFVAMTYSVTLISCNRGSFDLLEGPWLLLVFTYALFIPNSMRRAAIVIGTMSLTPVVLLLIMKMKYECVNQTLTWDSLNTFILMMAVAGGGSVFGVKTIGGLRRQAFEARQLGQYRLTQRIGQGGMGEVYLAEHRLLKRPCVVKLIRPDKTKSPGVLARFQREVRATAKLTHWNTVEIFDYGCAEDGTFYYVMEFLPGMNLSELVERYGPLPPERVVYLLRQACDALSEAHNAGLVHRDIKPGNIFAAERGGVYDVVKLLDFGLVKPLFGDEPVELTVEGTVTGSPLYMSPEQASGESNPDLRSDIYSLGAVGYFLLTGRPPFQSEKTIKILLAHINEPAVPPTTYRPEIPADLEQIILRCLSKSPDERFPDAPTLADSLDACDCARGWSPQLASLWWRHQELVGASVET
jgi:serine/threonine-protein kinase